MIKFYKKYEKIILIAILIILHTAVYKSIQILVPYGVSLYTNIDAMIPFLALFVIPYSLIIPVMVVPFVLSVKKSKLFRKTAYAFITTTLISDIIYVLFQTTTVRADVPLTGFFNQWVLYIYGVDSPLNCFPSLHVSMAALAFLTTYKIDKKFSYFVLPVSILIVLATVFIKQHNLIDVAGGLLLAGASYWFFLVRKS